MARRLAGVALLGVLVLPGRATAATPTFDDPGKATSDNGVLQLSWGDDLGDYEVRLQHDDESRVVYRGRLPSAHLSGLPDGEYRVQVRARAPKGWSPWSLPKVLTVRHHSLSLVVPLMVLGALVFLATAAVVLRSAREDA